MIEMAEVRFRVIIATQSEVLAKELFSTRKDADAYLEQYLTEEDNILESVGPGAYTAELDELFADEWVCHSKKLVTI